MTSDIREIIYKAPSLITGNGHAGVESSGRLLIPSPWKEVFKPTRVAYVIASRIGEIPLSFIFPEDNFRWLLENVNAVYREPIIRSAEQRLVYSQSRIVLPRGVLSSESSVALVGVGAYLQVTTRAFGELISSQDDEMISPLFNYGRIES